MHLMIVVYPNLSGVLNAEFQVYGLDETKKSEVWYETPHSKHSNPGLVNKTVCILLEDIEKTGFKANPV
jgi:hypothetical protein